jgi:hypothetical protein
MLKEASGEVWTNDEGSVVCDTVENAEEDRMRDHTSGSTTLCLS